MCPGHLQPRRLAQTPEAAAGAGRGQGPAQTTASSLSNASVTSSSTGSREQHLFYGQRTYYLFVSFPSDTPVQDINQRWARINSQVPCLYTARGRINTEKRWGHSPTSFLKCDPAPRNPQCLWDDWSLPRCTHTDKATTRGLTGSWLLVCFFPKPSLLRVEYQCTGVPVCSEWSS